MRLAASRAVLPGAGFTRSCDVLYDLKKVMTARRYRAMLVGAQLDEGSTDEVRSYLSEMRDKVAKGSETIQWLRESALGNSLPAEEQG